MSISGITKIVTHPGSAHMDEFMAICLAVQETGCMNIERRKYTQEDLKDPTVMVVDQGRAYQPELNNYDHHHTESLQSSLPLVAKELGLDELLKETTRWYGTVDFEDRQGPSKTAAQYGLNVKQRLAFSDPASIALLDIFKDFSVVPHGFVAVMGKIGESTIKRAKQFKPDYQRLAANTAIKDVDGVRYFVDTLHESPAREDFARDNDVAVVITPNKRGSGWQFSRIDDHPRVDFRNASALADLDRKVSSDNFIHPNGFIAVTTNQNADMAAIIKAALVPAVVQDVPPQGGAVTAAADQSMARKQPEVA